MCKFDMVMCLSQVKSKVFLKGLVKSIVAHALDDLFVRQNQPKHQEVNKNVNTANAGNAEHYRINDT